ncbi:2-nitropropane dioxygenase [Mycobacterium sp. ITM-2017-0098]|nr:2-nitropropane dioxygenase [Mycobacterium sp. ITM-2017-0098]
MGGAAGGALAAAVSRAGGLGMVGIGSAGTVGGLDAELRHLRQLGSPFGVGLVDWALAEQPDLLPTALAARPALLSVSFGETWHWVRRAHDDGVLTAVQVGDLQSAHRAVDAGVDVLIARGAEAGGHGAPRVGTLPLLAEILDELSVPVLAAGGISSGRALAAVLAAGASAAWIGTAFAACAESLTAEPSRRVLLGARDTDTVLTRVFDVAQGYPWPPDLPERVVGDAVLERWGGREDELAADDDARRELASTLAACGDNAFGVNAGQGVGLVTSVRAAADVIADMSSSAHGLLTRW